MAKRLHPPNFSHISLYILNTGMIIPNARSHINTLQPEDQSNKVWSPRQSEGLFGGGFKVESPLAFLHLLL